LCRYNVPYALQIYVAQKINKKELIFQDDVQIENWSQIFCIKLECDATLECENRTMNIEMILVRT